MTTHLKTYFTHSRSLAIGAIFASVGFLFGNWVTWIPYVKQKFALSDAQLGLLLLSMPLASTLTNPLSALILNRYGMRATTIWGLTAMALAYSLPVNVPYIWMTSIGLGLMGIGIAFTNVAMNTCVTSIERQDGIYIMSTSHGMFSAGGMIGSALASILMGLKVSPALHIAGVSVLIISVAFIARPIVMSIHEEKRTTSEAPKFAWPNRILMGMIAISFCTNVTEGTMADWTAVYMRDIVKSNDFYIGWGFAFYALFMASGRFIGDSLIPRYGSRKILVSGGILAAIGIMIAVLLPHTFTAILGFGMVGAGVSCGAPILYGSAARVPGMAKGAGLAAMNTFSLAGFLAGPAIIGLVSSALNLSFAIGLVAILALIWAFLSSRSNLY
ncbi:MFS transporter [Runella aurantiaca]|uniref:MFS transporter n=1 Tax=Runella aurantiaca TaxID=2282308 RepID=A0A369IH37_9BACT|nr:MFS transporter [Runella aurantiaca]RDB07667.1 MFS transporter [Runella aurantiaca]